MGVIDGEFNGHIRKLPAELEAKLKEKFGDPSQSTSGDGSIFNTYRNKPAQELPKYGPELPVMQGPEPPKCDPDPSVTVDDFNRQ